MGEISDLKPCERAKRYRELAQMARDHATAMSKIQMRDAYITLAGEWDHLAREVEYRGTNTEAHGKTEEAPQFERT